MYNSGQNFLLVITLILIHLSISHCCVTTTPKLRELKQAFGFAHMSKANGHLSGPLITDH